MNSVANSYVATTMNSEFGANQTTSSKTSSTNAFQKAFNNSKEIKTLDKDEFNAYSQERISSNDKLVVRDDKVAQDQGQVASRKEATTKETEVLKEDVIKLDIVSEVKLTEETEDVVNVDDQLVLTDEQLEQFNEELMSLVSELFGIEVSELKALMQDMELTTTDLLDLSNLTSITNEFFGLDNPLEILTNEEASTAMTELSKVLEPVLEALATELETDVETLKGMIMNMTSGQGEAQVETQVQVSATATETTKLEGQGTTANKGTVDEQSNDAKVVKLEVNDQRSQSDTTEYSHDNSGKESQSFASLMTNNANMTKEVVVINNGEQVIYKEISSEDVMNQIVTKAVVNLADDKTSMQIQLNPGHLGKIAISVTSEQGLIKGQFVAENQVVKEMIESNIAALKDQLEQQGVKVDKIEVTVGNSNQFFEGHKQQHDQSNKNKANQRRINRLSRMRSLNEVVDIIADGKEVRTPSLELMEEHTVEYSA